jgi:hypothetical protein
MAESSSPALLGDQSRTVFSIPRSRHLPAEFPTSPQPAETTGSYGFIPPEHPAGPRRRHTQGAPVQKRSKRILAATLAAMGVIAAGGVAYAFSEFVQTDSIASASADMQPLTVGTTSTQYKTGETMLWPGENHKANILIQVTNPNEVAVKVTNADIDNTLLSIGGGAGCTAALRSSDPNYTIDDSFGSQVNDVTIPANGNATIRVVEAVWLDASAPNNCQGKAVTSKWKITANSL